MRSGKRKGNECNIFSVDERCYNNYKSKIIQYSKAILKSGKNKGEECKCKSFKNGICTRHMIKEIV